jgi:hypothetical protein
MSNFFLKEIAGCFLELIVVGSRLAECRRRYREQACY